jgi:nucleotide-binding universal stress UspA family protein
MFQRWLVAHDFEPCAFAAQRAAVDLALKGAKQGTPSVVLAHVVTPPAIPMSGDIGGAGVNVLAVVDLMMKSAEQRLDEIAAELRAAHRDLLVETVVLSGSPVEALVSELQRRDVDALAVGTHGRRGLSHAFLGSVAERLVQRSPVPVFVVKEPVAAKFSAVA